MLGLILACAFAADTPTIIAKTLKPPIRTCFIRALLPFDKKTPHFLLVASTTIKSKREEPRGKRIFRTVPEQIFINAPVVVPWKELSSRRFLRRRFRPRGATACVSNQRAFVWLRSAGPQGGGPPSAGSNCRSRGCRQSPPARTSESFARCNSRA